MPTRFERHVHQQVRGFLQSVLLVDDEAYRRAAPSVPSGADDWTVAGSSPPIAGALELKSPSDVSAGDELDVQEVSMRFASEGLACAVLSPQSERENDDLKPAFVKTAKRADALVLDWNMNGDNGKAAEKLLAAVLSDDEKAPRRRLRLVLIYTGEPDLGQVADRIALVSQQRIPDEAVTWDDATRVAFSQGALRVAVFAKEHVRNLASGLESRRKGISDLPSLVIGEFGRHSMGLVTSAALSALAGIRDDAHRIILALGPEMDPALLGQRIALASPQDVERQVELLIGAEIQAVVHDQQVGQNLGLPRIKDWLSHNGHLAPRGASDVQEITAEIRLRLLAEGFSDELVATLTEAGLGAARLKRLKKGGGTIFFSESESERLASDRVLATRMSLRSRYTKPTPVLQLGSIVERGGVYALCVQPLCDSVRISGSRRFPLLTLEVASEGDGLPGHGLLTVIDERTPGGYLRLRVHAKPAGLLVEEFVASTAGAVQARRYGGVGRFPTTSGKSWRWVGDLRPDHAQRAVERLSAEFSRVGLDEAEVLRLGL